MSDSSWGRMAITFITIKPSAELMRTGWPRTWALMARSSTCAYAGRSGCMRSTSTAAALARRLILRRHFPRHRQQIAQGQESLGRRPRFVDGDLLADALIEKLVARGHSPDLIRVATAMLSPVSRATSPCLILQEAR